MLISEYVYNVGIKLMLNCDLLLKLCLVDV